MNKRQEIEDVVEEISKIADNIKSEIIVAGILEAGISPREIQIENQGNFARPYSKDLLEAATIDWYRHETLLRLRLSRNGIYDLLPEGVTHRQQVLDEGSEELSTLTNWYKVRKSEEAAARKFFRPFEQEFFFHSVRLEQEEHDMLYNSSAIFHDFLADFWDIAGELQPEYEIVLLNIMPFLHEIAGDYDKITTCLSRILGVNVSYKVEHRTVHFKSENAVIGKPLLGRNFTLGSCVYAVPYSIFSIGPVAADQLATFLPGGEADKFIQKFFKYTVPFESEVITKILMDPSSRTEDEIQFGVLGYSMTI